MEDNIQDGDASDEAGDDEVHHRLPCGVDNAAVA